MTNLPRVVRNENVCRARAYGLFCNGGVSRRKTRALAVPWICAQLAEIVGRGVADVWVVAPGNLRKVRRKLSPHTRFCTALCGCLWASY